MREKNLQLYSTCSAGPVVQEIKAGLSHAFLLSADKSAHVQGMPRAAEESVHGGSDAQEQTAAADMQGRSSGASGTAVSGRPKLPGNSLEGPMKDKFPAGELACTGDRSKSSAGASPLWP